MNARNIIFGSLVGDALALGPHWIYDQQQIETAFPIMESFAAPLSPYHPGKTSGDFTHYGDQVIVLLRSIAEHQHFDPEAYSREWFAYWNEASTISYRDSATRETLAAMDKGLSFMDAGSASHELSAAGRIAPLFLLPWADRDALLDAAKTLCALTHRNDAVIEATEFFARLTLAVAKGGSIQQAIPLIIEEMPTPALEASAAWNEVLANLELPVNEALLAYGLSCDVQQGFRGVLHILSLYGNDLHTALRVNALAGGDSAARGLLIGMVSGARPEAVVPNDWIIQLRQYELIQALIQSLH